MQAQDFPRYGKPEPCPAACTRTGRIQAEELFKDSLQLFLGNRGTAVFKAERDKPLRRLAPDMDLCVREAVKIGVARPELSNTAGQLCPGRTHRESAAANPVLAVQVLFRKGRRKFAHRLPKHGA